MNYHLKLKIKYLNMIRTDSNEKEARVKVCQQRQETGQGKKI